MTLIELIWFVLAWCTGVLWVHALQLLGVGDAAWFGVVLGFPVVLGCAWWIERLTQTAPKLASASALLLHLGLPISMLLFAVGFRNGALAIFAPSMVVGVLGVLGWVVTRVGRKREVAET